MLFFICGVIIPMLFIVYNFICFSKKKIIYSVKIEDFRIINEDFFKLQLILSCINALFVSINAYIADRINYTIGFLLFISIFWGINYLIKFVAKLKGYIKR
ncbi:MULTISPECIES: hypothetical protein [Clostridium]|uniref:hypothetical protein n=1 Tax=Clostridium TaxID=1485 RepID=UPI002149FE47|nr:MULTISPECIES: hypothetical protein [Clostridium]MCR1952429.1 hypothetical protein [Clostridium sp. DSM 100503]MDI9218585.1 hypothetical protein [Clostridium tertium]